jgi:hypothetical protein
VVIVFNEYSRRRLVRKKEGLKASAKKSVLKSIKLFFKMERTGGMWDDPSFKVTIGNMCEDVRIAWVYGCRASPRSRGRPRPRRTSTC